MHGSTWDFAPGLAALITAVAAAFGIDAWRRRLRGATEYKIALKTLEAVFALRQSIEKARKRVALRPDRSRVLHDPNEDDEAAVALEAQTYREQMTQVAAARESLLQAQPEAFALWGERAQDALLRIHEAVEDLQTTYERYFDAELDRVRHAPRDGRPAEPDTDTLVMKRILYSIPDARGKDPFGERLSRAVARAEEFFRGRLG
jgi:hypothetical protein